MAAQHAALWSQHGPAEYGRVWRARALGDWGWLASVPSRGKGHRPLQAGTRSHGGTGGDAAARSTRPEALLSVQPQPGWALVSQAGLLVTSELVCLAGTPRHAGCSRACAAAPARPLLCG